MTDIQKKLTELSDIQYKEFSSKLMPNIPASSVLGVRVPLLRKFAAKIYGTNEAEEFIKELPHCYYEENNVHAFLIEKEKNYDKIIEQLNNFLPYVDNWSTCDMMSPKIFKNNKDKLLKQIYLWLESEHIYTVRFAVKCLMQHFLKENFREEYLKTVCEIKSDEYYINMMIAWFFQEALTKQYESTIPYFEERKLSDFVHRKAISKACDSFRISNEKKEYLKTLR